MELPSAIIGIEAEQALFGAILHSSAAFDVTQKILSSDDFGEPIHKKMWETFVSIRSEGAEIKVISLLSRLPPDVKNIQIGTCTFQQYVVGLYTNAPSVIDAKWFAYEVKKSSSRRKLLEISKQIEQKALADFESMPSDITRHAIDQLDSVYQSQSLNLNPIVDSGQAFTSMLQEVEDTQAKGGITGVSTGFKSLDNIIGGLSPSDLVIVAGRPGMGKSAFAGSMMLSAARAGAGCIFFSLEMSSNQLIYRLASEYLYPQRKVMYSAIMRGSLRQSEKDDLHFIHHEISKLSFRIDPTPAITVAQMALQSRKYKSELEEKGKELKIIFVDYLQIVKATTNYRGNKVAETTEVSNSLKALAKDLNVCVVALSQMSRGGESDELKRPQLHHLRESGAIEQDANIVLFPFREEYYLKKQGKPVSFESENKIEILVAKNRNGSEGTVVLNCDIAYNHFSDLT